jgi:uncharacterized protein
MQFNVAQLLKEPTGATRKYEIEESLDDLDPALVIQEPIRGQVKFTKIPSGVLVTGDLETVLEVNCNRCLEPFDQSVRIELEEEFRASTDVRTGVRLPRAEEADEATFIDEKHIIDLSEVVRQAFLLNLPTTPLCRSDCKGLCPICGLNLNEGQCDCPEETIDPRWDALRAFLDPSGEQDGDQ